MRLTGRDILSMPREELRGFKRPSDFDLLPDTLGEGFRITIFKKPIPGHLYVMGSDFCQGIEGADLDAAAIFDKDTLPVQQVAELHGRWGPERYDRLLYAAARYYQNAFIVGERQFGLPVLRSLINNLHYAYIYYQRDEASRGRRRSDILGHYKGPGDPTIPLFRMALRDDQCVIRSPAGQEELRAFQWRPRAQGRGDGEDPQHMEDLRDQDLKMGAPAGMHDDLVNAYAYGWKGILEVHNYIDDRPKLEEGRAGAMLGMRKAMEKDVKKPASPFAGY